LQRCEPTLVERLHHLGRGYSREHVLHPAQVTHGRQVIDREDFLGVQLAECVLKDDRVQACAAVKPAPQVILIVIHRLDAVANSGGAAARAQAAVWAARRGCSVLIRSGNGVS